MEESRANEFFDTGEGYGWISSVEDPLIEESRLIDLIKDNTTKGHCGRVAELLVRMYEDTITEEAKISGEYIPSNVVHVWGILHDLGKNNIDENTLNSDKTLTSDQWKELNTHILPDLKKLKTLESDLSETVIGGVIYMELYHHQNVDMDKGYSVDEILKEAKDKDLIQYINEHLNNFLSKNDITFLKEIDKIRQILTVADCADAMYCPRPYKAGYNKEHLFEELESDVKRGKLNKDYVDQLIEGFDTNYNLFKPRFPDDFSLTDTLGRTDYIEHFTNVYAQSFHVIEAEINRKKDLGSYYQETINTLYNKAQSKTLNNEEFRTYGNAIACQIQNRIDTAIDDFVEEIAQMRAVCEFKFETENVRMIDNFIDDLPTHLPIDLYDGIQTKYDILSSANSERFYTYFSIPTEDDLKNFN